MQKLNITLILIATLIFSCQNESGKKVEEKNAGNTFTAPVLSDSLIYQSENLEIRKLSDHVYEHVSFLETESFGKVPCNGMVVVNEKEAVVFDTPATEKSSRELIRFLTEKLSCKINAIVATHFHEDCVAGLKSFHQKAVPSYSTNRTISLLKSTNQDAELPVSGFDDSLSLKIGNRHVTAEFLGYGHTKDNIIGYFPYENIMFGGCLVKEVGAGKGNLADADTLAWASTVRKVKEKFPQTMIVIPGHGKRGGQELLDYTIKLFSN